MNDFLDASTPHDRGMTKTDSTTTVTAIAGTEQEFRAVHLGNDGYGKFKDSERVELEQEGFNFDVSQNSAGGTFLVARPREGHKVEAFEIDEKTKQPVWRESQAEDGSVYAVYEGGNMHKLDVTKAWPTEALASPGWRVGVVRVTDTTTQEQSYYALGAKFTGRADNWNVKPAVAKVAPIDLSLPRPSTPPKLT